MKVKPTVSKIKRFEVPYNFEDRYMDYILPYKKFVNLIYIQAFNMDCNNARSRVLQLHGFYIPDTWEDYIKHIKLIKDNGFSIAVLFQENKHFDNDTIERYIDLGIDAIITTSDDLARYMKEYHPEIFTICSITKMLTFRDYFNKDLSMYDECVLDFPFERGLSAVEQLPRTRKYSIIINNNGCRYDCKYRQAHWFNVDWINETKILEGYCHFKEVDYSTPLGRMYMTWFQQDLRYFDPYIYAFKLQGRDYSVDIIRDTLSFFTRDDYPLIHSREYFNDAVKDGTLKM